MVSLTRRTLLSGAVGLTAALAGCSGQRGSSAESTPTASQDDGPTGPVSGSETDPETLLVRTEAERPPIWTANPDGRPTVSRHHRWRNHIVVDGSERAERISVADAVDGDRVASFLDATEFDAETVYIEMGQVAACFRLDLCRIGWSAGEISTDYARRSRPYTARCAVDESVVEARLIRIPAALDADDVNSYSSSIGTGECDPQRGRAAGDDTPGNDTADDDTEATASSDDAHTETPTTDTPGEQ